MKLCQSFVSLDKSKHLIKDFDCGKPDMNQFISRFAVKHAELGLSRTLVLPLDESKENAAAIVAYYTLAFSTISREKIPRAPSLPRYPLLVVLLARLAVDIDYQKRNLGKKTLIYALRHAVRLCDKGLPAYGLIVDVLDDEALKFYQKFNLFHSLTDEPMRLFVPMSLLQKI